MRFRVAIRRFGPVRITFDRTIFTDDELVEIPLDGFPAFVIWDLAQLSVQWMPVVSIDLNLRHHGKGHTILRLTKRCNLHVFSGSCAPN